MSADELDELVSWMEDAFDKYNETDFLEFDRIKNKRCGRPDLHAFLLLDSLIPGKTDIVSAAEHDEIFLGIEVDELAKVVNEDKVEELVRCGVRLSDGYLCMFV